ncbi:ABC transporter permease [Martelella mediterranea]|uniref:Iron(III) transport system permease protein n=1 Tax=Martelella mediterranea TaxID=293089 RepID=A0A4R3NXJ7_9HYPH|nr:iron ABC transporter permease [Martelella mediterranea]TCT38866.1 iron(III) transport system permease protein [Martelella mediterranea]
MRRFAGLQRLTVASTLICALMLMPVAAIFWIAATGDASGLSHLAETVLPRTAGRTLSLLIFNAIATGIIGVLTAWLVVSFDFPFRRLLSVALVLPMAMPIYLSAYAFGEFFDFTGPVQTIYRALFGFQSARDYSFPDIRSLGGVVLVMASVLYPYVYLAARSVFLMQGRNAADVARTLGAGRFRVFWRVQLPMARPAIVVGLTLVMMESLNDIGAVQYLGVNTLTFSIYETWLNRGSLAGAAQLAAIMLVFVFLLILLERIARRNQRYSASRAAGDGRRVQRQKLIGWRAFCAALACLAPVLIGFVIPALVLLDYALKRLDEFASERLFDALLTSISVSALAAVAAIIFGLILSFSVRTKPGRQTRSLARLSALGYGIPGTVLAIGVLIPLAALDNAVDGALRNTFNISTGLILSGSGFAIVYACTVRFLAMAEGNIDSGFQKLSPSLDMAARTLGRTPGQALFSVLLPNMRPALLTAALLVFIETLKELSATILLRPFNFNTLATLVYEDASRSQVESASVPAMIIILAGLIPVLLVSRSMDPQRTH